ncbi:DUF1573 domain-containing protein [Flavobacterium sp.]|uniref:DUF1573 domain-containing protein n=1 Tax=Flavobacterium sp. TaxID=239 RepID=UPI003918728B
MKKRIYLIAISALLAFTTACKKDNAAENNSGADTISVKQPEANMNDIPVVQADANGKYPVMTFDNEVHDFGTIQQGDKPSYVFEFKNTGEADLIITSAKGSCGCTVPEYPKTPIKPGESGNIKVSFNSAGKTGSTAKTVSIMCNTAEGNKILTIKANIEVPKGAK